jgi:hypothetical protein
VHVGPLREMFPDAIHLHPDDSGGKHLWAVFPCDEGALRVSLLYGTEAERLNALDAAVIAAFARSAEENAPVGTIGSGGPDFASANFLPSVVSALNSQGNRACCRPYLNMLVLFRC